MSIVTVKAAIVSAMRDITNIGLVDDREGRMTGLPWDAGDIKPMWVVSYKNDAQPGESPMLGAHIEEKVYSIRGYFPHYFEANSQATWDAYLDIIKDTFKSDPAIPICANTFPPLVRENSFVMYGGADSGVLCHFALIDFVTQEWIFNT